LLQRLRKLDLERDTIVVYLTDNGPQHRRFNAGMRGLKGTVYQGGIRVPCFLRWPGSFERGRTVGRPAAHIDLCPTLLEACGVRPPTAIDGRSLMPLLRGDGRNWPARSLFFQWHRGDEPEAFRNCAVRRERYKLVDGGELYDLEADPGEERNLAGVRPELVASLRKEYEAWFRDVSATRGYAPPRIFIGTPHENPVILTRQDWRGPHAGWKPDSVGYWEVDVREAGNYAVKVRTAALPVGASVHFRLAGAERKLPLAAGGTEAVFQAPLERGPGRLEAWVSGGARRLGALYVEVEKAA
jgi:hypothetical protein